MNLSITMPWKGLLALRPLASKPCLHQRFYSCSTRIIIPKTSTVSVFCRRPLVSSNGPSSPLCAIQAAMHTYKPGRRSRRPQKQTSRKEGQGLPMGYHEFLAQHDALPGGKNEGKLYVVFNYYRLIQGDRAPLFRSE